MRAGHYRCDWGENLTKNLVYILSRCQNGHRSGRCDTFNSGVGEKMNLQVSILEKMNRIVVFLLIIVPVISFVINFVSWLRFGVDVPLLDDMRQYSQNAAGRMDWSYITTPANDTLYSVGLIFDALAFRFLDGNSIAYQAISMIAVLGGILYLQWRLLALCTDNYVTRAMAFAATIFMLQPDSYWGLQNMAFHQAVPVLCSLLIVYLVLSKLNYRFSSVLIFLIATVSGFTYTSGAFANFSILSALIILVATLDSEKTARIKYSAIAMFIPTLLSVAAQLWVLIWVQHGTHRPDAPMAYPWESDFWYFMLGKVGRSLMLPMEFPELSMIVSIGALVLSSLVAIFALYEAAKKEVGSSLWKISVAYLCVFGVVSLYLCIITAGRANLRPESLNLPKDIFLYGFARFHFFWACVLWPWVVALLVELFLVKKSSVNHRFMLSAVSVVLLSSLVVNSKIMDHPSFYRTTKQMRLDILSCLSNGVSRGIPFECPSLHPRLNMLNVYYTSLEAGASYAMLVARAQIPLGSNDPRPLFRLTDEADKVIYQNATPENKGAKGVLLETSVDPMMIVNIGDGNALKGCWELQINGSYHLDGQNFGQLFYKPSGSNSFSEADSQGNILPAGDGVFSINARSKKGFENMIRFDPVIGAGSVLIKQLEVRCVLKDPGGVLMY